VPVRKTKRGNQRTPLNEECDVLICGASFAGLTVARELSNIGKKVLLIDRYEIGERATSACAAPTEWLDKFGLNNTVQQTFEELVIHTPHTTVKYKLPFTFSTFNYRKVCEELFARTDATFETAKVEKRNDHTVITDRGEITAPLIVDALGWRRILGVGKNVQPPNARLSRGLEVHPNGQSDDLEIWIDRKYVPAGYGWSFPADNELRVGVGSFDPKFHVKDTTVQLAQDVGVAVERFQGNWIPHQLRSGVEDGIFFVGDSAGHCLPLTAEGIRPAFYFGLALGRELRRVLNKEQSIEQALKRYGDFNDSHEWQYKWMLRAQDLVPKIPPKLLSKGLELIDRKSFIDWSFNHYFNIANPSFID